MDNKLTRKQRSELNKKAWAENRETDKAELYQAKHSVAIKDDSVGATETILSTDSMLQYPSAHVNNYISNRADVIADLQLSAVDAIRSQDLRKAPLKDLAMLLKNLNDIERLERGQSTSNVDILASACESIARKRLGMVIDAEISTPPVVATPDINTTSINHELSNNATT